MLTIVSGPFHPDLEAALVSHVQTIKQGDPLRPLTILVPSQHLATRVKRLLAVESNLTLLDTHVLTFHQFALTLIQGGDPARLPDLVDGLFQEELLRSLVARGIPGAEVFRDWAGMRGLWAGLWATIQDLKEARVETTSALSAVAEGLLGEDRGRMTALLCLYAAVLEADHALHIADADDLATLAMEAVERVQDSPFLARMAQVFYYGFYDLTQGQLDLFKAVAARYPTTVFFPQRHGSPAYRFARQFFATYIQGLGTDVGGASTEPPPTLMDEIIPQVRSACHVFSAVGPEDEVAAVAKEILHLTEDLGFEPLEIGVVARTRDPYLPFIRRVFNDNRIPFACAVGEPLISHPLVKTLLQFMSLPGLAFPRVAVLEVLSSPAFRLSGTDARPDWWEWATRRLGITRGNPDDGTLGEWSRLERAARTGLDWPGDEDAASPSGVGGAAVSRDQLGLLWDLVQRLHADLMALPARAGWEEYAAAFSGLFPVYFDLPAWTHTAPVDHEGAVHLTIRDCLASIARLAVLDEQVSLEDWTALMVRVLERARVPSETRDRAGVQVLDAMDARGIPFRALFVLGLNEKVFPRSIREDAFLRDGDREVLARDLGFKIARKLDGFDEERLLFALLLRSCRERLYLGYQRADRHGRTLVPSGYLTELACERESHIKRRPTERWAEWPYRERLLSPREM